MISTFSDLTLPVGSVVVVVILVLAGCQSRTIDNSMIVAPPGPVSFADNVLPILQQGCDGAGCHIGFQSSGTDLSSYDAVVSSIGVQYGEAIVNPGDAKGSPLFDKLLASPRLGQRMPVGTQLSASDIELIKVWIDEGANDN